MAKIAILVVVVDLRMNVNVTMFMTVVPQLGFIEQKKEHQTRQQRAKQHLGANLAFESLGQQVHEGGGKQCTSGQA